MSELEREERAGEGSEELRVLAHATLVYRLTQATVWTWLQVVHRMRVEGRQHVPRSGGVMLLANHASFLDIPLVAAALGRHVSFVARESLARSRPLSWLMRQCGAVLLRQGGVDRRALREMALHLERGDCVAIFPEGSRSADGSLGEFRRGALLGTRDTPVPLVPTAIQGTYEAWPRQRAYPLPRRVSIRFGEPVDSRAPQALEKVRARIAELLEA